MVAAQHKRNRARLQRLHRLQAYRLMAKFKRAWRTYGVAEVNDLNLLSGVKLVLHVVESVIGTACIACLPDGARTEARSRTVHHAHIDGRSNDGDIGLHLCKLLLRERERRVNVCRNAKKSGLTVRSS